MYGCCLHTAIGHAFSLFAQWLWQTWFGVFWRSDFSPAVLCLYLKHMNVCYHRMNAPNDYKKSKQIDLSDITKGDYKEPGKLKISTKVCICYKRTICCAMIKVRVHLRTIRFLCIDNLRPSSMSVLRIWRRNCCIQ